jgi:pyruvate,water dikinase
MDRVLVTPLERATQAGIRELGGKAYSLALLIEAKFNVPRGFVVTTASFFIFLACNGLAEKIRAMLNEIDEDHTERISTAIRDLILSGQMPTEVVTEVGDRLKGLHCERVAVRSSAASEDTLDASFAGMFDTFLNIEAKHDLVAESVKRCWASLFNERAMLYRIRKGIPHLEGMAVLIQEMICADVAGTVFTANPITSDRTVVMIEATWGLGEILVSGAVTPDLYVVSKRDLRIVKKNSGRKKMRAKAAASGVERMEVEDEKAIDFCLEDATVVQLAKTCLTIESLLSRPQDIEWAIAQGNIWILQSRPITDLRGEEEIGGGSNQLGETVQEGI